MNFSDVVGGSSSTADSAQPAPFWLAGIALLLVLVVIAAAPRIGYALLGILLLVLLVNAKKQGNI